MINWLHTNIGYHQLSSPPALEMPATFNSELLETNWQSDDLDMSRTDDGTLKITHQEDNRSLDEFLSSTVGLVSAVGKLRMIRNTLSQDSAESIREENVEAVPKPSNSDELANSSNKGTHKVGIAGSDKVISLSDSSKASFSSQDRVAIAGSPTIEDVRGSEFPPSSQRPGPVRTPDHTPKSPAALIDELRQSKDVEDLTGQFEHTSRRLVARGGYSEVHFTHWLDRTRTDSIPVR